ncbi:MYSM1 deubiquitinase, partial [Syrrhaptes paradoxus]|nr:MYSM1 deubiquitinase [Syrrhaptes paradoxus]
RRWTKIAKLIGSRTVLQVKSYARQYFKNKAKHGDSEKEEQSQCGSSLPTEDGIRVETWSSGSLRGRADPNLNAVKIEKLSDDEEVDITDDMDELLSPTFQQETGKSELSVISEAEETKGAEHVLSSVGHCSVVSLPKEDPQHTKQDTVDALVFPDVAATCSQHLNGDKSLNLDYQQYNNCIEKAEQGRLGASRGTGEVTDQDLNEDQRDLADNGSLFPSSCQVDEDHQEEAEELKAPDQEVEVDRSIILEEEKQAIPEFFEGRQAKTPERYLKIRNYILDQW